MPETNIKKGAFKHLPNSELLFFKQLTLYKLAKEAIPRILSYIKSKRPKDYLKTYKSKLKPKANLPDLTDGLNHYEHNIKTIIREAKSKGISLIFITQPTIWKKNLPKKIKTLLAARAHYTNESFYTGEALNKIMTEFNKRLIAVCNKNDIPVSDLQLPKSETIYYDDMHFNEFGAEVVAENIYQFLKYNK